MNCILLYLFNDQIHIDIFFILESIFIYGNLYNDTNILIYTTTIFMNLIKNSYLYNDKIKFEIDDSINNINNNILNIFNIDFITDYNRILYLDINNIVKNDLNMIFKVCQEDILYVLAEGTINSNTDIWGKTLFGAEINNYKDKTAFTNSILLFNNCEKIKYLFSKINEDIIRRPYNFSGNTQPYLIYNAFKYNLFNNKILKSLVTNNDDNISSNFSIHCFTNYNKTNYTKTNYNKTNYIKINFNKINYLSVFLNKIKQYTIKIPKVLFQTNKINNDAYVLNMINNKLTPEWEYKFFNDTDVIQYFIDNPLVEFPNIITKYNSFKRGAHRADLFRYYYLYINGGIFMDSDAMLYINIDNIVKDYNFISVESFRNPNTIFQGIIGASPKNSIIKKALYDAYNTNSYTLDNYYHHFCKQLYDIIKYNDDGYNIKLYKERMMDPDKGDDIVDNNIVLFRHYWKHKKIPL